RLDALGVLGGAGSLRLGETLDRAGAVSAFLRTAGADQCSVRLALARPDARAIAAGNRAWGMGALWFRVARRRARGGRRHASGGDDDRGDTGLQSDEPYRRRRQRPSAAGPAERPGGAPQRS